MYILCISQGTQTGLFMNKTIKPVVEKSALPTKKRSTWKWNLPLESIKKGELIKLEMSEDEARDNSNTIRTIVHRFQKKTPSKKFTVRLVINDVAEELDWEGIGIWRTR
jgi:hypothetical protein|tara:strand:+ start:2292 stop:2618 length:327 start_codon:yes stop_codon:yes gene_type:complete